MLLLRFLLFPAYSRFLGEALSLHVPFGVAEGVFFVEFALLEEFGFAVAVDGGLFVEVGLLALGFEFGALEVLFAGFGGGGGGGW